MVQTKCRRKKEKGGGRGQRQKKACWLHAKRKRKDLSGRRYANLREVLSSRDKLQESERGRESELDEREATRTKESESSGSPALLALRQLKARESAKPRGPDRVGTSFLPVSCTRHSASPLLPYARSFPFLSPLLPDAPHRGLSRHNASFII